MMRRSGIDIIGDVTWGTHFCQFYYDKKDLLDILTPFFRKGLEENELCMWVTSEPLSVNEARDALRIVMPELDDRIHAGQIEFLDYRDWYIHDGQFKVDEVLQRWMDRSRNALDRGYEGLRVTGNTFWVDKADWQTFTNYEKIINTIIGQYPILALCSYSINQCNKSMIVDVLSNHQFTIVKDRIWRLNRLSSRP